MGKIAGMRIKLFKHQLPFKFLLAKPCLFSGWVLDAAEELTLDRAPATKLSLENHDSSLEQKKNCTHYAVIGRTLLLRACPLPTQPPTVLPAGSKIALPYIKKCISLPELRLHLNYSQFSKLEAPHRARVSVKK
jgi:hypothetical protein